MLRLILKKPRIIALFVYNTELDIGANEILAIWVSYILISVDEMTM